MTLDIRYFYLRSYGDYRQTALLRYEPRKYWTQLLVAPRHGRSDYQLVGLQIISRYLLISTGAPPPRHPGRAHQPRLPPDSDQPRLRQRLEVAAELSPPRQEGIITQYLQSTVSTVSTVSTISTVSDHSIHLKML